MGPLMNGHPEESCLMSMAAKGGDPAEELILALLVRLRRRAFVLALFGHLCRGIALSWGAYLILWWTSYARGLPPVLAFLPLALSLLAGLRRPTPFEVAEAMEAQIPLQGRLVAYLEFRGRPSPLLPLLARDTAERLKDVTPRQVLPLAWPKGFAITLIFLLLGTGALWRTDLDSHEDRASQESQVARISTSEGTGTKGSAQKGAAALRLPSASSRPAEVAPEPRGPGKTVRREALRHEAPGERSSVEPFPPPAKEMPEETGRVKRPLPITAPHFSSTEVRPLEEEQQGPLSSVPMREAMIQSLPSPLPLRELQGGKSSSGRSGKDINGKGPGRGKAGSSTAGPVEQGEKELEVDRFHLKGEGPLDYYEETRGNGGTRKKIAYREVFARYQETVEAALSREEIPAGYRRTVRDYFDAIGPRAITKAGP